MAVNSEPAPGKVNYPPELTLPLNLVLVRHGLSEGNAAKTLEKERIHIPEEHRNRHSSKYRLVYEGIQQAKAAGNCLRQHFKSNLFYLISH